MSKRAFPSFSQWKQIFKVLKKKERNTLIIFSLLAVGSALFLIGNFYVSSTQAAPAFGGTYVEGVIGQPRFINPVYGETSDVDRTLIDLVFSGLMAYDSHGNLTTDLAETYNVSEDGKTYEFTLKKGTFWHDGRPVTADDIVFTIQTIQSPEYKSPLRANWLDIEAQKVSDKSVRFVLRAPYNGFLENCTVKIIPKHIWENISPESFSLSFYNLQPIGSGPFMFTSLQQTNTGFIKTIQLESNRHYYHQPSHIANINFQFFEKKEELTQAINSGGINGFGLTAFDNNNTQARGEIRSGWGASQQFSVYSLGMPRYFAVFFNQKSAVFADSNVRKAFSHATDRDTLVRSIEEASGSTVTAVNSPILPDFFGYVPPLDPSGFDTTAAATLLDKAGYKQSGSNTREKAITKKPAFQFSGYLRVGSKGNEVTQLQSCLARLDEAFKTLLGSETNGTYGKATEQAVTEFQKKHLSDLAPTGETGQSTRKKLNELCLAQSPNTQPLKFTLVTANQPQLVHTATLLQQQWAEVGAQVEIQAVSAKDLKAIIKARSYDALLYGEALGAEPDLYPFWHSSQKIDPGLNLSAYENKEVDSLLKQAREALDASTKAQRLEKLQNTLLQDSPAIFLYNPNYEYWVSNSVQGIETEKIIDPAKRFSGVTNWFIKTKRTWK